MPGIDQLMDLVSRILDHLDGDAAHEGFRAPVRRGSASGFVSIEADPDDPGERLLIVRLEIMPVPARAREPLLERLLLLNHDFRGRAAFSLDSDGHVSLTAGRPLAELDAHEILDLVLWTSQQADDHDDALLAEFG
jgi:hypothetical protein